MVIQHQYQPEKLAIGLFGGILSVTLIAGAIMANTRTYADTTATDDVTITIASACTFTGDATGTEHTTSIIPGTVESNIGTTRMTAVCNDPSGYDIYAVGYSGNEWKNTNLIYEDNSGTTHNIPTGTATSGNTSNWAMKLAAGTGDGATIISPYNDYAAVPGGSAQDPGDKTGDYVKVATYPQATTGASGSSLTSTYRVYATSSQVAGTYTGQVKYTLVHPQGAEAPKAQDEDLSSLTYMQDFASLTADKKAALIAATTVNKVVQLKDSRDNTTYNVAKLADGNVWMLDNLALDLTSSTVVNTLSADNTNADSTTLGYLKNGGGTTSDQYATAAVANWTSGRSYSAPLVNMDDKDTVVTKYGSGNGKVGGYYNYCAASAGGYCYGNDTSAGTSTGNATTSICPAGWRMPTGGGDYEATDNEYNNLATALGLTWDADWEGYLGTDYQTALGTPLSGYFDNGSAVDQGDYGYWWSSTRSDSVSMYGLYADSDGVGPTSYGYRDLGYSMRCVAGS